MKNYSIRFEFDVSKFAAGECDFASLIFNYYSHFIYMHGLPQLNKKQYYHIHVIAAISLSPSLDYKNMAFFVFCEQLLRNFEKLSRHLIR